MSEEGYAQQLKAMRRDLQMALAEREELDRKIGRLRQMVIALGALCQEDDETETIKMWVPMRGNLTDVVLSTITASSVPLGAKQIRDTMLNLGYRFHSSNSLGSIHSVLKRLQEREALKLVAKLTDDVTGAVGVRKYWYGSQNLPAGWVPADEIEFDKKLGKHVWRNARG
jgi:hypothetical protein